MKYGSGGGHCATADDDGEEITDSEVSDWEAEDAEDADPTALDCVELPWAGNAEELDEDGLLGNPGVPRMTVWPFAHPAMPSAVIQFDGSSP